MPFLDMLFLVKRSTLTLASQGSKDSRLCFSEICRFILGITTSSVDGDREYSFFSVENSHGVFYGRGCIYSSMY
jgi:hypothetical protein